MYSAENFKSYQHSREQNFAIKVSLQTLSSVVMFDTARSIRVISPEVSTYIGGGGRPSLYPEPIWVLSLTDESRESDLSSLSTGNLYNS